MFRRIARRNPFLSKKNMYAQLRFIKLRLYKLKSPEITSFRQMSLKSCLVCQASGFVKANHSISAKTSYIYCQARWRKGYDLGLFCS